jgi:riboflavin kinase
MLHSFSEPEFYGSRLRVVVLGYLRPEQRFSGLQELLARIKTDIGLAKAQLDEAGAAGMRRDVYFN